MQKGAVPESRWRLIGILLVLAVITAAIIIPTKFVSSAAVQKQLGLRTRTESFEKDFPNFDIRENGKDAPTGETLAGYRQRAGKSVLDVADVRGRFVEGEKKLRETVPTLRVEYNSDIRIPEVIAPDVNQGWAVLTGASTEKRSEILRSFVKQNSSLVGVDSAQADQLRVTADYTNPAGNLSYAHLDQFINNVPVFRGEIKAGFTKNGEMFRVINNLAPALDYSSLSTDFGDPADGVRNAFKNVSRPITPADTTINAAVSSDLKTAFGQGDWATTAEKMYFPTEPGVARTAWRVLIWQPVNAYYVIVDAETGQMLWRKNLTNDQTQSATYNVYTDDSPAPLSPTNATPGSAIQGASVGRNSITVIGNEAPNPGQDDLGWITDGVNITDGNNVEAGLDIDGIDGVDAPLTGSPNRVFSNVYNPPPGGSDIPSGAAYRSGVITNLFYWTNRYHDIVYNVGFTEAARNFQNSNFGRGGAQADRISAQAQDSSGTNNANFTTPADGSRPKMQMYLFTGPSPQRDGSLDGDVFLHEMTHGTSNRLIGNGSGLGNTRGGGMGEGWSDFYGRSILATASENVNGVYAAGAYVTLNFSTLGTDNYYYGIRRFPYAVKTTTGGPGNRPHNPLTLADIDPAQISTTDGAFPITPWITNTATEVHNEGEVWCMMLLEVRARVITSLGFAAGNTRMLQITTDGMKLTPLSPNFVQARDAIIAADQAGFAGADVSNIWAGFATRGNGFGAVDSGSAVTESFSLPNAVVTNPFSVSDSTGDNDGFPEPGENVLLSVAITNNTGNTVTNVTGSVAGGGSANYGNIPNGGTVTRQIPYTVPAATACGSLQTVSITSASDLGTQAPVQQSFRVGVPVGGAPVTFANTGAITIVDNAAATPYPSNIAVSGLTGNKVIKLNINGLTHTFPGDLDILLVGPGGQKFMAMSDMGGGGDVSNITLTLDDAAANTLSTSQLVSGEFKPGNTDTTTDVMPAPAPAAPYLNPAPAGTDTLGSAFGVAGSGMNGTWSLYVRDDAAQDTGQIAGGWSLTFEANDFACSVGSSVKSRADFDGDGKTDLSVFRPSDGNWYTFKSAGGVGITNWGAATDTVVPGDYDNDGKADTAVYRPSTGQWFILRSSDSTVVIATFGIAGDLPVVGDYDGDGKADEAVYRPSAGQWYAFRSSDNATSITTWGNATDVPVQGDYDGDGKTDVAVFRPSTGQWFAFRSTAGPYIASWGVAGDKPVQADYDGDNKDDLAVFRPSDGNWYIFRSSDSAVQIVNWGSATDVPVPGDYDGDGKDDQAVYRNGTWFVLRSTSGPLVASWGVAGDTPIPAKYIP